MAGAGTGQRQAAGLSGQAPLGMCSCHIQMNVRQRAPAVQEDLSHRGDQATSHVGRSPSLPPALPALTQRAPEQGPRAGSFIEAGLPAATAAGPLLSAGVRQGPLAPRKSRRFVFSGRQRSLDVKLPFLAAARLPLWGKKNRSNLRAESHGINTLLNLNLCYFIAFISTYPSFRGKKAAPSI